MPTEQERKLKILPRSSEGDGSMEPTTIVGEPMHHQHSLPHPEMNHEMNIAASSDSLTSPPRTHDEDPETIAAAAAAVVDASVNHVPPTEEQAAAAAAIVSATIEGGHRGDAASTDQRHHDQMMSGGDDSMNHANSNSVAESIVADHTQHLVHEHMDTSPSHHEV